MKGAPHDARELAKQAVEAGAPLRKLSVTDRGVNKPVDLAAAAKEKRVLLPADRPTLIPRMSALPAPG